MTSVIVAPVRPAFTPASSLPITWAQSSCEMPLSSLLIRKRGSAVVTIRINEVEAATAKSTSMVAIQIRTGSVSNPAGRRRSVAASSLIEGMKTSIHPATIPGRMRGMVTSRSACQLEWPSTRGALEGRRRGRQKDRAAQDEVGTDEGRDLPASERIDGRRPRAAATLDEASPAQGLALGHQHQERQEDQDGGEGGRAPP